MARRGGGWARRLLVTLRGGRVDSRRGLIALVAAFLLVSTVLLVLSATSQPRRSVSVGLTLVSADPTMHESDVLTFARSPAVTDGVARAHLFAEPHARRLWRWLTGNPHPSVHSLLLARTDLRLRSLNGSRWSLEIEALGWTEIEADRLARRYVEAVAGLASLEGLPPRDAGALHLARFAPPAGTLAGDMPAIAMPAIAMPAIAMPAIVLPSSGVLHGRRMLVVDAATERGPVAQESAEPLPGSRIDARSVSLGATLLGFLAATFGLFQVGRRGFSAGPLDPATATAFTGLDAVALHGEAEADAGPSRAALQALLEAAMRDRPAGAGGIVAVTALDGDGTARTARRLAAFAHKARGAAACIDADLGRREGRAHPRPGLADILEGRLSLGDAIRHGTGHAGLPTGISAGRAALPPRVLLALSRFEDVLEESRARFATTILLAPPVGCDAFGPVASRADAVIVLATRRVASDYLADRAEIVGAAAPRARVLIGLL